MEIVKRSENKVSVYELVYDEETIKNLISDIIKTCSIRVRGRYRVEDTTLEGAKGKINASIDSIGNKVYENISNIRQEYPDDPFGYWRPNDPVPYSFEADMLVSPKLVEFLNKLLSTEKITSSEYESFEERKELSEKSELIQKMYRLNNAINQISNFDTERKIKMLNELADYIENLKNIPDFDYEILSAYYDLAVQSISLQLVEETIKYK